MRQKIFIRATLLSAGLSASSEQTLLFGKSVQIVNDTITAGVLFSLIDRRPSQKRVAGRSPHSSHAECIQQKNKPQTRQHLPGLRFVSVQICRSCFFQNRFQRRISTCSTPYRRNNSSASGPIRSPDTAMGIAGGHPTVGAPQTRPNDCAAGTVSRGANSAARTEHTRSPRASGNVGCGA